MMMMIVLSSKQRVIQFFFFLWASIEEILVWSIMSSSRRWQKSVAVKSMLDLECIHHLRRNNRW